MKGWPHGSRKTSNEHWALQMLGDHQQIQHSLQSMTQQTNPSMQQQLSIQIIKIYVCMYIWASLVSMNAVKSCLQILSVSSGYDRFTSDILNAVEDLIALNDSATQWCISLKRSVLILLNTSCNGKPKNAQHISTIQETANIKCNLYLGRTEKFSAIFGSQQNYKLIFPFYHHKMVYKNSSKEESHWYITKSTYSLQLRNGFYKRVHSIGTSVHYQASHRYISLHPMLHLIKILVWPTSHETKHLISHNHDQKRITPIRVGVIIG